MKTRHILHVLVTVILIHQVRSEDLEVKALSSEEFVPYGEYVWLNCSTPLPEPTHHESRLQKNGTMKGPNWVATKILVDDFKNSTVFCYLEHGGKEYQSFTRVMAYTLPSNVTIDLQPQLEEGQEHTMRCTVHDVAPLEFLTINITRGGDVIDSVSYSGPHVEGRVTQSHEYKFNASRSDNFMNFTCVAILQLGSMQNITKSPEITVQTYALPNNPVITVENWIERGTKFQAECLVTDAFPPENVNLKMIVDDSTNNVVKVQRNGNTIKGLFELEATYTSLGANSIRCEANLFTLTKHSVETVNIYVLPIVNLTLPRITVDLNETVDAYCDIINGYEDSYGLSISVDGKEKNETSMQPYTFTASRRTPSLLVICTAYIVSNRDIKQSTSQTLQVHYPPKFTENSCPSIQLLVEGKDSFSCEADGNPKPHVECSSEGKSIDGSVTLTKDKTGTYTCQATNQKGNTMKTVHLQVDYAPMRPTVTVSSNATIRPGDSLNITCQSDGFPPPIYSWNIPQNAKVAYAEDNSSIIISTVGQDHSGIYTCKARNNHGEADTKLEVTVVPEETNILLYIAIALGIAAAIALIASVVGYTLWRKGRTGEYKLLTRLGLCQKNGNIASELPKNDTHTSKV
ncbi:intercellular adhesion molecule 5-like [Leptodactylus fuscus]|uniref:intercellular adhesion molecule 5-like n=1 Tax=Leptodactylus fuscus TaxID=238119 RepID=UPI003F4E7E69